MLPIFLVVLVDVFALTLILPLLAPYAERFGASPLEATLLVSVFALCQLFSGPLLGSLSDRHGRKPWLLISQLGTLVGLVVMAEARSLAMLYVARVIDGATAGNLSLAQAWISDHTKPSERTRSFALIGIAFGTGFFIGPWASGALAHAYDFRAPVWLACGLSALSIACTALLLPGGPPPARSELAGPAGRRPSPFAVAAYAPYFRRPVLGALLVQFFLFMVAFSTFTSGFALFAERRFTWEGRAFGPREIGWVFAYAGLLGIVLQGGLIGRLVTRFGDGALAGAGFAAASLAYVGLGLSRGLGLLGVVVTVSAFGNGVLRPTLTSLVSQQAAPHEQGTVLGVTQSLGSLAAVLAPALGGFILERGALGPWAWVSALATAAGLLVARWGSGQARAVG